MIQELFTKVRGFFLGPEKPNFSYLENDPFLKEITEISFDKLEIAEGHIHELSEPYRTVVIIISAQKAFSRGGIRGFYTADSPLSLPYPIFIEAFERIGYSGAAKEIKTSADSFRFKDPHTQTDSRTKYMRKNIDPHTGQVRGWTNWICQDDSILPGLSAWAKKTLTDSDNKPDA